MNPFNLNDTDPLRSTDLMIAYLEDRAGEEDTRKIEALIESDDLYRLSLEQLADQLSINPLGAQERIEQVSASFEEALEAAKYNFVNELETAHTQADQSPKPTSGTSPWVYLVAVGLIGLLAWAVLSLQNGSNSPIDPLKALHIDGDMESMTAFIDQCGEAGIGRGPTVSLHSALVEHFAESEYKTAAAQFEQLQAASSGTCQAYMAYYKAQSYMEIGAHEQALSAYAEVIAAAGDEVKLKHAALWFTANIHLSKNDLEKAETAFRQLRLADKDDPAQHIKRLLDKGYLIDTEKYLNYLDG